MININQRKKARFAAKTTWSIDPVLATNERYLVASNYLIQTTHPMNFLSRNSALIFAKERIQALHYYEGEQNPIKGRTVSTDWVGFKEFYTLPPYFILDILKENQWGISISDFGDFSDFEETRIGAKNISIYLKTSSGFGKSDLSLQEYAALLNDECIFVKLEAEGEIIDSKFLSF